MERWNKMILKEDDIKDFTLGIENGYFMWKIELKDSSVHQIKYRYKEHITPKGNKSKIKEYFIRVDGEEYIFNEKLKKWFKAFRMPYIRSGI